MNLCRLYLCICLPDTRSISCPWCQGKVQEGGRHLLLAFLSSMSNFHFTTMSFTYASKHHTALWSNTNTLSICLQLYLISRTLREKYSWQICFAIYYTTACYKTSRKTLNVEKWKNNDRSWNLLDSCSSSSINFMISWETSAVSEKSSQLSWVRWCNLL